MGHSVPAQLTLQTLSQLHIRPDMGAVQSRDKTDSVQADTKKKKVAVEEIFVQKIAYKCGVTDEELDTKREKFQQHAGSDPTLGFQEFKSLYRDISGRQEDAFLNNYVESVFRAFDADKDSQLTFREWQVGFYLLLLLPTEKSAGSVNKEDFLLALEIIFRLYDQDANGVVTEKEIKQISRIIQEPAFRSRFDEGVLLILEEVDSVDNKKKEGGVTLEEFLKSFSK